MSFEDFRPIDVSFTPDTNAYSSGDVVGGLLTLDMTTCPTLLVGVTVSVGEASKALAGTIYLYNAVPTTTFADNAAFAPVHADNAKMIGDILLPTALSLNSRNVYSIKTGLATFSPIPVSVGKLWIYYVTTSTPTFSAAQTVNLRFFQISGI